MIYFNVVTKKTFQKNGEERAVWNNVGRLVKFDATADKPEQYVLELNMFPNTKFYVFDQKPKDALAGEPQAEPKDINPEDIPY